MKSVLLADDFRDTVEMMSLFLDANGYEVDAAYDGEQALQLAQRRRYDALILDVGMPRINGFDVAQKIRKFSDVLIVGCSGFVEQKFYDRATTSGFDYYLSKPTDPDLLLACLEPEKHPSVLNESVILTTSRNLQKESAKLIARAQALSFRSAVALSRAREICRKNDYSH
jgi:CheY-like chemotaxis protein